MMNFKVFAHASTAELEDKKRKRGPPFQKRNSGGGSEYSRGRSQPARDRSAGAYESVTLKQLNVNLMFIRLPA
jgi:hypothetical protein